MKTNFEYWDENEIVFKNEEGEVFIEPKLPLEKSFNFTSLYEKLNDV